MILNPHQVYKKGVVSSLLDAEKQIQMNGIDITVSSIQVFKDQLENFPVVVAEKTFPQLMYLPLTAAGIAEPGLPMQFAKIIENCWQLQPGKAYFINCHEKVDIPIGTVGKIYIRSTLNRGGCNIGAGLYDAGFKGFIGFTLYPTHPIIIKPGDSLAQIVITTSEYSDLYDGYYQNQTIHVSSKETK